MNGLVQLKEDDSFFIINVFSGEVLTQMYFVILFDGVSNLNLFMYIFFLASSHVQCPGHFSDPRSCRPQRSTDGEPGGLR